MASSFRMQIHRPHENRRAAFSDFSTLRPVFKKVRFQDPCGRSAKTIQYMCVFAWTRKCNGKKNVTHRSAAPKRRTAASHNNNNNGGLLLVFVFLAYLLAL